MLAPRPTPASDLALLGIALRQAAAHPWSLLGLALLGALLGALGPLLQLRTGNLRPEAALLLGAAAMLPLELYFVPRFLARLDAERLDRPENPKSDWRRRFDERWLRAFGAKLILGIAAGLGFLLILPGLLIVLVFGWTPFRVLLRGESLGQAARASARIAAVHWPRILFVGCSAFAIYLGAVLLLDFGVARLLPEPTLAQQITHPILHLGRFLTTLLGLWLSLALLELYLAVEEIPAPAPVQEPPEEP